MTLVVKTRTLSGPSGSTPGGISRSSSQEARAPPPRYLRVTVSGSSSDRVCRVVRSMCRSLAVIAIGGPPGRTCYQKPAALLNPTDARGRLGHDMDQSILWRRLDRPGHEFARVIARGADWHLIGSAVFVHERQPCRLDYLVVCDPGWRTRSGRVTGWVGDAEIEIDVAVDPARRWRINGRPSPAVEGCIDLDLNFSPSTNLFPIRRLGLAVGEQAPVRAAWLRFPGFTLEPLE